MPAMEVGILLYHHVNELDVVLPLAVFSAAKRLLSEAETEPEVPVMVTTVARSRFSVQTSGGLTVTPGWAFASAPDFDLLFVPGGPGLDRAAKDPAVRSFFATRVPAIKRVASISSGSLLLGALGLLEGQEVTGHPETLDRLAAFGDLLVVDRPLAKNDRIWSARSPPDGFELALELLGACCGSDLGERVRSFLAPAGDLLS